MRFLAFALLLVPALLSAAYPTSGSMPSPVTWDSGNRVLTYTGTVTPGEMSGTNRVYTVSWSLTTYMVGGVNWTDGMQILLRLDGGALQSTSGNYVSGSRTYLVPEGTDFTVRLFEAYGGDPSNERSSKQFTAGAGTTYKVTFALPANTTNRLISYRARQGTTEVASFVTGPGDPAREVTITGLTSNAIVVLEEVSIDLVFNSETGQWDFQKGAEYVRTVNGGSTPVASTATGSSNSVAGPQQAVGGATGAGAIPPASTPVGTPMAPSSTPHPSAPSIPANVPVATPTEKPTPTGDSAATKQDIMTAANQMTDAIDKVQAKVVDGSNAVKAAVDEAAKAVWENGKANVAATDKVASAVWEANKTAVQAANATTTSVDAVAKAVRDGNEKLTNISSSTGATASKLDATNSKLDALINVDDPAATDAHTATPTDLSTSTLTSKLLGKLPAAPTITTPSSTSVYEFNFPIPGLSQTVAFRFDLSQWSSQITIFRTVAHGVLIIVFFFYTLRAVKEAFA